jgi:hypothetical protein
MFRTAEGERRWAVVIVALILCGSPLFAILLNQSLPGWSFLPFELRNLLFLLLVPLVFGVVSETRPLLIGEIEARDGYLVFAAIVLIGWFLMLLEGWAFGFWANFLPLAFFLSQVGAFHAGRWLGRIPRRKLSQETADG